MFVKPASNAKLPRWGGERGRLDTRIVQKVRDILMEDTDYPYLRKDAETVLNEARQQARIAGILEKNIIPCGEKQFAIYPWVGGKTFSTIVQLLRVGLKDYVNFSEIKSPSMK